MAHRRGNVGGESAKTRKQRGTEPRKQWIQPGNQTPDVRLCSLKQLGATTAAVPEGRAISNSQIAAGGISLKFGGVWRGLGALRTEIDENKARLAIAAPANYNTLTNMIRTNTRGPAK